MEDFEVGGDYSLLCGGDYHLFLGRPGPHYGRATPPNKYSPPKKDGHQPQRIHTIQRVRLPSLENADFCFDSTSLFVKQLDLKNN